MEAGGTPSKHIHQHTGIPTHFREDSWMYWDQLT